MRASGVIHADETPWWQGVLGRWLWVVLSATTAVFQIGSRRHEEIRDLLGDAILGFSATRARRPNRTELYGSVFPALFWCRFSSGGGAAKSLFD